MKLEGNRGHRGLSIRIVHLSNRDALCWHSRSICSYLDLPLLDAAIYEYPTSSLCFLEGKSDRVSKTNRQMEEPEEIEKAEEETEKHVKRYLANDRRETIIYISFHTLPVAVQYKTIPRNAQQFLLLLYKHSSHTKKSRPPS